MKSRRLIATASVLVGASVFFAFGCSGKPTATVSGKVMFEQKQIVFGTVTLVDEKLELHVATIKEDGTYTAVQILPAEPVVGAQARPYAGCEPCEVVLPGVGDHDLVRGGLRGTDRSSRVCRVERRRRLADVAGGPRVSPLRNPRGLDRAGRV